MSVQIDGATLSSLLFSTVNSNGSQYGFLLGERIEQIEDRISDSQIHTSDVNSFTNISSFIPWPSKQCIYSRGGHINDEWLELLLTDSELNLIGWYSFRHNTSCRPSLREITLHNNLAVSAKFGGHAQDFLFLLGTSSFTSNLSTHGNQHGFMHMVNGHFVKVPMTIMNLGDTTRKEYRQRSNATFLNSKPIQGLVQKSQNDFQKSSGEMEQIVKMNNLSTSMNKALMTVHTKVLKSETELSSLEAHVNTLRQKVEALEQEEMVEMFQMKAEQQREEEEDRWRQDEQEDAEEQKQLERLLIDLGISCDNTDDGAMDFGQPASNVEEPPPPDQSLNSFQVIDPTPSLPLESFVYVNNVDGKAEASGTTNNSANLAGKNEASSVHKDVANGRKVATAATDDQGAITETHTQQNTNQKADDPFSFIEDQLSFKRGQEGVRKPITRSHLNRDLRGSSIKKTGTAGSSTSNAATLDTQNKQLKDDTVKAGTKNKEPALKKDGAAPKKTTTADNVNGTLACDIVETQDINGTPPPGLNTQDDSFTLSSSPVF